MKNQFIVLVFTLLLTAGSARAASMVGLDSNNNLVLFDSATPGITTTVAVTGVGFGEQLIGLDYRPATGMLYGLVKSFSGLGRVLQINPQTGAAAFSSVLIADSTDQTAPFTALSGNNFGVNFNGAVDRLRVVSDTGMSIRVNVDTGNVITDGDLNPGTPSISGIAYTNSFSGASSAMLFDIDVGADTLNIQNPPNNGTLSAVGPLGVDATGACGFDILTARTAAGVATNTAFAALTVGGATSLYTIDLATGAATLAGPIGTGVTQLRALTAIIAGPAANAYTIDTVNGTLVRFNTAAPGVITAIGPVGGLAGISESIIGMDFRPATGDLYIVTKESGLGRLYTLNTVSAFATLVGVFASDPTDATDPFTSLTGTGFGVDFNPAADRLRIVSDDGRNLRVNPNTASVITDADLNPGNPGVSGAGYINSFAGATTTTLFDIDRASDQLFIQNPPNNGTLVAVGSLGVDATAVRGFDINANNAAFAILTVAGTTGFYGINLDTGAATLVGAVDTGATPYLGLALAPAGVLQFESANYAASEGDGVSFTINRVGGTEGVVSVVVAPTDGTAVAGEDFQREARVFTFSANSASITSSIPVFSDEVAEADETFTLTLRDNIGGSLLGNPISASVTVADSTSTPSASSGPTANPNPAFTDMNVALSVVPYPINANVSWNFGDGSSAATGMNVNHVFTAAGTYTVTVTIQNPITSATATATLQVTVTAAATDGSSKLPGTETLRVKKGAIKLTDKKNSIALQGTFPITGSETIASPFTVSINGVSRTLTLSTKGAAKDDKTSIKLNIKSKKGVISAQDAGYTIALTGADIAAQLASGVATDVNGQPKLVVVKIQFGGHTYSYVTPITVVAKGKTKAAAFGNK